MPKRPPKPICDDEDALRDFALTYPEATEDFPWDHRAFKVRGKVFVFLACDADGVRISVKLAETAEEALLLPFAEPTGYGLGRHGWVSASFGPKTRPPIPILKGWIDESYRAVAPKKLSKLLDDPDAAPPAKTAKKTGKKAGKKTGKKKVATKKTAKKRAVKKTATKVTAKKKSTKAAAQKKASKKTVAKKTATKKVAKKRPAGKKTSKKSAQG